MNLTLGVAAHVDAGKTTLCEHGLETICPTILTEQAVFRALAK